MTGSHPAAAERDKLPAFYGDGLARIQATVDWVHRSVRKAAWDPQRLRDRYLRRSVSEILADGDTLVVGPCPDRTAVASAVLSRNAVPYQIVVHERHIYGYGPPTIHMALEFEDEGQHYWCDFGFRETRFMRGRYVFEQGIEKTIQIVRFSSEDLDPLSMTLDDALRMISPKQAERESKVDWFCSQLKTVTPDLFEERIAYEPDQSVYWSERSTVAVSPGM